MNQVSVTIDGRDVSEFMRPYMIRANVTDMPGVDSDTAHLTFDDSGGQLQMPKDGAAIVVYFHGIQVFEGVVDSVQSTGGRGDGRLLQVGAKGFDSRGKVKELQRWHLDDATLQQALDKAAGYAGLSGVVIDPAFASIFRDYWSPDGASFLAWGQRLANELGGTFKIRGKQAVLAKRGTGQNAVGAPMPTVTASSPGNIISWQISPIVGRPRFTKARVSYFDRETASFKFEEIEIAADDDRPESTYEQRTSASNSDQAKANAEAMKTETDRKGGTGSVTIDFDGNAQAEGTLVVTGTRPGIDGTYRITSVQHKAERAQGTTTTVSIEEPGGGAGKDERKVG